MIQGAAPVCTKILFADMAPLWMASLRFFVAALSLLPFVYPLMRRQKLALRALPWPQLMVIGILQTTGVMAFLNIGLTATTPSTAAILMASNPLLVVILARIFLGEKAAPLAIAGLVLAFVGVVVCIGVSETRELDVGHGETLVMLASACWAASTVFNKKFDIPMSPWIVTFWQMLIGAVALAIVAGFYGQPFALPATPFHWSIFIWLAVPASTGAMGLWFAALKIGGSVQTSGFLFLCPLFAALIAFFFSVKSLNGMK